MCKFFTQVSDETPYTNGDIQAGFYFPPDPEPSAPSKRTLVHSIIRTTFTLVTVGATLISLYRRRHQARSKYLAKTGKRPGLSARSASSAISLCVPKPAKPPSPHTHPISAAARTTATNFCRVVALRLSLEPFMVQMSNADIKRGLQGSRTYYWSKDLAVVPQDFNPPPNSLLTLIDVDYYMDMVEFLSSNFAPVFIYAFQPDEAAAVRPEYSYTFLQDQCVDYKIAGGNAYKHQVWNYNMETVTISSSWMSPRTPTTNVYRVERYKIAQDRIAIVLLPVIQHTWFSSFVARTLDSNNLTRLAPVVGDYIRLDRLTSDQHWRSTARVGTYVSATIPASDDDGLSNTTRVGKSAVTVHSAIRFTEEDPAGKRLAATLLVGYNRDVIPTSGPIVIAPPNAVKHYTFHPNTLPVVDKPSMTAYMSPLLHECYAPVRSIANDTASIQQRLQIFQCIENAPITEFISTVIREFVTLLVPEPHLAHPCDEERVYEKQNRPSQQRLLVVADFGGARDSAIDSMQKAEAYASTKDPRNISIIRNADVKRDYSRFMYVLTDHVKKNPWYAFGLTPAQIAERIGLICLTALSLNNSDLSRFDGHVGKILRMLELALTLRLFNPKYHDQLYSLQTNQYNLVGRTTHGLKYNSGYTRASGSPETSILNTVDCAFIPFLAFRTTKNPKTRAFYTPEEAWSKLGCYGGDDGVTPDLPTDALVRAAKLVGQVSTCFSVNRGHPGVEFLARKFGPDVWNGDTNSCCDIARQLSKFHATPKVVVSPLVKLQQKALSYYLTDSNTPVVGAMVRKLLEVSGTDPESEWKMDNNIVSWFGRFDKSVQFPNTEAGWMWDILSKDIPTFDYPLFADWCNTMSTRTMFSPPLCAEPKPPKPANTDALVISDSTFVSGKAHTTFSNPPPGKKQKPIAKSDALALGAAIKLSTPTSHSVPAPRPSPKPPDHGATPPVSSTLPALPYKPPIPLLYNGSAFTPHSPTALLPTPVPALRDKRKKGKPKSSQ